MAETLGFVGLGSMGMPIATNLLQAGYGVRVFNRTASKAAALTERGASLAAQSADVAQPGGVVLTMVSDDRAIEEICLPSDSFVERLGPGGVHISLSTIAPSTSRWLAEHHAKFKVDYVAAPVFGRPAAAATKLLWIVVSGPAAARQRAQPIFNAIGQGIFEFGEDPGAANVVKLCGNFMLAAAIEALSEGLTLAQVNGLDKKAVIEMLGKTVFACPAYQNYGRQIADEKFDTGGFRLVLGLKDINLAIQTAAANSMPMPLASLLRDRWLTSVANGRGEMDWTAVALDVAADAGLAVRKAAG